MDLVRWSTSVILSLLGLLLFIGNYSQPQQSISLHLVSIVLLILGWVLSPIRTNISQRKKFQQDNHGSLASIGPDQVQKREVAAVDSTHLSSLDDKVVISWQDAVDFWQEISRHPELNWKLANTGCEARADFVAELAENRDWKPKKIWMFPSTGYSLWSYINTTKTEIASWSFHVALLLWVDVDGVPEQLVLDPTQFNQPVDLDEWISRFCDGNTSGIYIQYGNWRSYWGYTDMLVEGYRQRALEARRKTLKKLFDLNDSVVFAGQLQFLRAQRIDQLHTQDKNSYDALKQCLKKSYFNYWFNAAVSADALTSILSGDGTYYGIQKEILRQPLDMENPFVYVDFIFLYWAQVGRALERLDQHAGRLFKGRTDEEVSHNRACWFCHDEHDLWVKMGIDPASLADE